MEEVRGNMKGEGEPYLLPSFFGSEQSIAITSQYCQPSLLSNAQEGQVVGFLLFLLSSFTGNLFEKGLEEVDGYREEGG